MMNNICHIADFETSSRWLIEFDVPIQQPQLGQFLQAIHPHTQAMISLQPPVVNGQEGERSYTQFYITIRALLNNNPDSLQMLPVWREAAKRLLKLGSPLAIEQRPVYLLQPAATQPIYESGYQQLLLPGIDKRGCHE